MDPIEIQLSPALSLEHKRVLSKYLATPNLLTQTEWSILYEAVDFLRVSRVSLEGRGYTFAKFYDVFVDAVHADGFLETLWDAGNVEAVGRQEQAA